jgi:hypothetical protein
MVEEQVTAIQAVGKHVVNEIWEWLVTENWECRLVTTVEKKPNGNVSIAINEKLLRVLKGIPGNITEAVVLGRSKGCTIKMELC